MTAGKGKLHDPEQVRARVPNQKHVNGLEHALDVVIRASQKLIARSSPHPQDHFLHVCEFTYRESVCPYTTPHQCVLGQNPSPFWKS